MLNLEPREESSSESWRSELLGSYTSVRELAAAGLITCDEATRLGALGDAFKARVTPYYASLMERSPACPIRRQAIPALDAETDPELPEWAARRSLEIYGRPAPWDADAIGDLARLAVPRLTHRYGNRAILHLSSLCAVYCRFCFRKGHLNDDERALYEGSLEPALKYLARTPSVRELILTGGDPLSLPDAALRRLLERLAGIESLRMVRVHSRMPVTLPSRITPALARLLGGEWPFHVALASHFNHPRELSPRARAALRLARRAGVTLLNQTVLLARVNDSAECLAALFQELYEEGVVPFHLHHPDWTPGTFGFRVPIERGRSIARELRGKLSGPALPEYVLDLPGGFGKAPLLSESVRKLEDLGAPGVPLAGAVYAIATPETRAGCGGGEMRYLDLWRR